jgi:hypothetical protein
MKVILNIFIIIISFTAISISKEIQISSPIVSDYYDCIYKENQIIVYGSNGVINISNDDGKTWDTKKIFERGKIIFMSHEADGIYAVNENGVILKSTNYARYFLSFSKLEIELEDRIWSIIKNNDKIIFRTLSKLFLFDNMYNLIKVEPIPNLNLWMYENIDSTMSKFTNNIAFYNENVIVSLDSAQFLIYDKNLKFKEKLDLFYKIDKNQWISEVFTMQNKIIFSTYNYVFKYDFESKLIDTLFKYKQNNKRFNVFLKGVIEDKFMFLSNQDFEQYKIHFVDLNGNLDTNIQVVNKTYAPIFDRDKVKKTINKVAKKDNKYILLGNRNTLIIVETEIDDKGNTISKTKEVSKGFGFNPEFIAEPYRFKNNVIFTLQKNFESDPNHKKGKEHVLFKVEDENTNLTPYIPYYKRDNGYFNTENFDARPLVRFSNFNKKTNELNIFATPSEMSIAEALHYKTKDFFRDTISYIPFFDNNVTHAQSSDMIYTDLFVFNEKFIFGKYIRVSNLNYQSRVHTFQDNFLTKNNYWIEDSSGRNKKLEYMFTEDDKKYSLFYYDYNKSTFEIKTSNNTFDNYQSLYTLNVNVEFLKHKTVEYGNIPYVIYLLFNKETYKYSIEMLNLRDYSKFKLYEFTDELIDNKTINFDVYQENIYLSIGNKFLHFKGTLESPEWDEYSLPNNGEIYNYMYIQNNFLYCKYSDDKNDFNLYRIELVDSLVNSVEIDIENEINSSEYVYLYEPYPNPTNNEINTEVFWSNSFDIDNSDIGVFNLNGNKVSSPTNLTLEKLNANKGNIKWDCVGQPKGTYLIKIQHGNNTKTVKVVVN